MAHGEEPSSPRGGEGAEPSIAMRTTSLKSRPHSEAVPAVESTSSNIVVNKAVSNMDKRRSIEREAGAGQKYALDKEGSPAGSGRQQHDEHRNLETHVSLRQARVAEATDRGALASASKHDIHSVKVLGEGAFGIVDLVRVTVASAPTPLLCVRKKLLKATDNNPNDPAKEVEALAAVENNLFVTQMWSSVVGLYDYTLLLEYCPYGTLERFMQEASILRSRSGSACLDFVMVGLLRQERHSGLSEDEARFYTACAAVGLEGMHKIGYLHRDIKPSNCLIADNRYLKLSDLGLTKYLGTEGGKAYSTAGTPCYMAPEIVHGGGKSGYGFASDMWSLGIMLWEMVAGTLPKWAAMSWYWTQLHFPPNFSPQLCELLRGMLQKNPKDRMTVGDLLKHPWLTEHLDVRAVRNQTMEPPNPIELQGLLIHAVTKDNERHNR